MQKNFLLEDLKERDHLKDVSIYIYIYIYTRIILVWLSKKLDERMQSGFTWLKIGTCGAFLSSW